MARVPLLGGAYQARSLIANAQRCINLYPEVNPGEDEPPVQVTQYLTPGLTLLKNPPSPGMARCAYRASNGELFVAIGPSVYFVDRTWTFTLLGTIANGPRPVSMRDNSLTIILVDGTSAGYAIDLTTHAFSTISDAAFYGGDRVDYLDTFFLINRPGTNQFYVSPSNWIPGVPFDPLDIAAKTGGPDGISAVIVTHREAWVIGTNATTEVWYDAGAADFAFQALPGAFIEHGCGARYSIATQDLSIYWLSLDPQGHAIILRGAGYQAVRISTHAIEEEFRKYATVSDAIGFCYQQEGHAFYVITFPTADATWVFDAATEQWHQRAWADSNGVLHRHRANCCAFAYDTTVVGDWQTGALYALDLDAYTDNGAPIIRIRGFPHAVDDGKRRQYRQFIADMQVGTLPNTLTSDPPQISLRWSDDRGASWGNPVMQTLGSAGQTLTSIQFQRLGIARDRVFEIFWSIPAKTALQGAFVDSVTLGS